MDVSVSFPLFVFEKNDYSMFVIETHMDPIDIENDNYLCWDANGRAVRISIAGQRVTGICYGEAEITLEEAFKRYSEVYGLDVETSVPLDQMRTHLKEAQRRSARSSGLLSELFKRGRT